MITVARIPLMENVYAERQGVAEKPDALRIGFLNKKIFHSACNKRVYKSKHWPLSGSLLPVLVTRLSHIFHAPQIWMQFMLSINHDWVINLPSASSFCLITQVLQLFIKEVRGTDYNTKVVNQSWWPVTMRMLRQLPILLFNKHH